MFRTKLAVLAAAMLGALSLGGCNMVMSSTPMFSVEDMAGAPPLKPGVWASPDPNCTFDKAKPAADWPGCASGAVISGDKAWAVGHPEKASPYVIAAGDPRVMQAVADISSMASAGVTVSSKGPLYLYIALKPTAHDGDGRITAADAWFIQCGPPPPKPKDGSDAANDPKNYGTKHPLPGLVMDNGECAPKDKAAVRNAASASRAWADQVMQMYWVRDGEN